MKRKDGPIRTKLVQSRLLLTYTFGPQLTSDRLLKLINEHRAMLGRKPLERQK